MPEIQSILPPGAIVHGRFIVEDLLGKGGFGAVYLVGDQRVKNNRFALKEIIDPDARTRKNFTVECELLRRLDHPALPRFYSVFNDAQNSRIYLLMDYVAGQNLDILRQRQPEKRFSLPQAVRLVGPIMDAVSYLHQCEPPIIHRDIKPANIIVAASKDDTVLVDFGLAKEYDQDATTTAIRRLSPHYSAPEQYTFGTSPRTDIYGLAATLYVMLSGVVPVDAFHRVIQLRTKGIDPLETLAQRLPQLAPEASVVIERAMSIHAEDRFASAQEFWLALQATASDVQAAISLASLVPHVPIPKQQASEPASSELAVSDDIAARDTSPATTASVETHDDGPAEMVIGGLDASLQTKRSGSRHLTLLILAMIVLFALVAGIFYGTGKLPLKGSGLLGFGTHQHSSPTRIARPAAPTAHVTVTVTATQSVKSSPTAPVAQRPTSPVVILVSGSSYAGSVDDQSAHITGDLTFTHVQQQGSTFRGTLSFSNGLSGQANFNGTITPAKNLSFIVTPYTQYLPLLFKGKMNADGTLSGTYCSERNNVCDYSSGGYGTWQMAPK